MKKIKVSKKIMVFAISAFAIAAMVTVIKPCGGPGDLPFFQVMQTIIS